MIFDQLCTVVHINDEYDVYIGRPSKWGNPYIIGKDGTREEVLDKYSEYILNNSLLLSQAKIELKGKKLGCYCKPKACHGDILANIVNNQ